MIEQVLANYDQPSVALDELLGSAGWSDAYEWRLVEVNGRYRTDEMHLVRNRPLAGLPGFLVLVPFELEDGRVIAIERGWLATGATQDSPDVIPAIDSPIKTVQIRLRSGESSLNRDPVDGQLASIDLLELSNRLGTKQLELDFYGRVVSEFPSEEIIPTTMPAPPLSEGNHLSYAFQWILFGIMAIGALLWAIKNERQQQLLAAGKLIPVKRRKSRAEVDAEVEDAFVDSR